MNFVIYSEDTARIRRVLLDAIAAAAAVSSGESVLQIADDDLKRGNAHALQALVLERTGKTLKEDRYVVVDETDKIIGVIHADPLCGDAIPGHTLVKHASAEQTWGYQKHAQVKFEPPVASKPPLLPEHRKFFNR